MKSFLICFLILFGAKSYCQVFDSTFTDESYYHEFYTKDSIRVIQKSETRYHTVSGQLGNNILLIEKVKEYDTLDREQNYYDLTLTALENSPTYNQKKWHLHSTNEKGFGIWYNYYLSVIEGCCGAEDEYQFYDIENGKKIFGANVYKKSVRPFNGLIAYKSISSSGWASIGKNESGVLYLFFNSYSVSSGKYISQVKKLLKIKVIDFSDKSQTRFSPEINLMDKADAMQQIKEYANKMQQMNVKDFILLNYYDGLKIIIPFDNGIPLISSAIISDSNVKLTFIK